MSNKNIMTTIGARNFAKEQREENDFYATDNSSSYKEYLRSDRTSEGANPEG